MSKMAFRHGAANARCVELVQTQNIYRVLAVWALAVMMGLIVLPPREAEADEIFSLDARVVAQDIPGASALAQVGTFLNVPPPGSCARAVSERSESLRDSRIT